MYATVRTYAAHAEFVDQLVRHQSEVKPGPPQVSAGEVVIDASA